MEEFGDSRLIYNKNVNEWSETTKNKWTLMWKSRGNYRQVYTKEIIMEVYIQ